MSEQSYYETMYILRPDIPEDEVDSHIKKYNELLQAADVKVLDSQMRGKRRLAYTIGKHKEGIYVQLSHQGNGQHIAVMEKAMRISEDVIRYLTVIQHGPLPTPRATPKPDPEEKEKKDNASLNDKNKIDETKDKDNSSSNVEDKVDETKASEINKKESSQAEIKEVKQEVTEEK